MTFPYRVKTNNPCNLFKNQKFKNRAKCDLDLDKGLGKRLSKNTKFGDDV